jgi:hypothetical protein
MPISDYASAFFFARRNRVTLQDIRNELRDRDCNFKSVPALGESSKFSKARVIAGLEGRVLGGSGSWKQRVLEASYAGLRRQAKSSV